MGNITRKIFMFALLILGFQNLSESVRTEIDKLLKNIFHEKNYNIMIKPEDDDGLTLINTELKLLQIELNEKYQELISIIWLEMSWYDERFMWNLSEHNITDITLPVGKIWVPDLVLQNGVAKNEYLYDMKQFNPWISHTGLITWVPEIRIHTKCGMTVTDFPFDIQRCEINFYSWAHTVKQLKLQQFENKNTTNITHLNQNTEWFVFHTCAINKTVFTSNNLEWWMTSYTLFIKRRNYYHMFNLIIPYFILTLCSTNLFLLPPQSGEKISLAVSLLLTYFLNLAILSNYIPESSNELPIIALTASVFVLSIYFKSDEDCKAPTWLKVLLLIKPTSNNVTTIEFNRFRRASNYIRDSMNNICEFHQRVNFLRSSNSRRRDVSQTMLKDILNSPSPPPPPASNSSSSAKMRPKKNQQKMAQCSKQLAEYILGLFNDLIEGIDRRHEELISNNQKSAALSNSIGREWRMIGRRIDNCLLLIFIIVVIISQVLFFWDFYNKNRLPKCNACSCEGY